MWKLEFWKLEVKFENRNFEKFFKDEILKINKIIIIIINKCENWNFGNWKLNSKIGSLKIIWELEFWRLNYELEFWKLNYENWNLGNYLKMEL